MVFPGNGAASAPAQQAPPQSPPAGPPANTPPAQPPSTMKLWVNTDNGCVLMDSTMYGSLDPTTSAMNEDQSSGWQTIGSFLAPAQQDPPQNQPAQQQQKQWGNTNAQQPVQQQQQQKQQQGGYANQAAGSPYGGVESAQVGAPRNKYLEEGDYVVRITSSFYNIGRKGNAQIIELQVIEAQGPVDANGNQSCNPKGSDATIYYGQNEVFLSNIKRVVLAASGFDQQGNPRPREDVVTQQECDAVLNGDQPACVGALVYIEARKSEAKNGNVYTNYEFWPIKSKGNDAAGLPIPDFDSLQR